MNTLLYDKKKKMSHPLSKCFQLSNVLVFTSIIQTVMMIYIVILLFVWYHENKPAIDAITKFPWVNATNDATKFYVSIRDYNARKTLDTAQDAVQTVNKFVHEQDKPLNKISEIVDEIHKDKDITHHAKNIIMKLYKPVETIDDNQDDVVGLIHNIKKQSDNMKVDEVHQLIENVILIIQNMNVVLTKENIQTFFEAASVMTEKMKKTDVDSVNKLVKDTDDTMIKVEKIGDMINRITPTRL